MKNVIGVAMIGVAIYAYIPLVPKNIVPEFTTPDAPVPTGQVKEKVMDLKDGFSEGEKIRGLFAAVSQEIGTNESLAKISQVKELNEKAFTRYLPMAGFSPYPGLGNRLDEFVLEGIETDNITPEVRDLLVQRYMALEWLAQGGRDDGP